MYGTSYSSNTYGSSQQSNTGGNIFYQTISIISTFSVSIIASSLQALIAVFKFFVNVYSYPIFDNTTSFLKPIFYNDIYKYPVFKSTTNYIKNKFYSIVNFNTNKKEE